MIELRLWLRLIGLRLCVSSLNFMVSYKKLEEDILD